MATTGVNGLNSAKIAVFLCSSTWIDFQRFYSKTFTYAPSGQDTH